VIDHVVAHREMLEAMFGWLQPRPVWFVTLAPDLSTARARNATRPERERIGYDISGLYPGIQRELSARCWWFDTSTISPQDTAHRIIAEAAERAVVTGHRCADPIRSRSETN
jgi:chloramphenicol 3-O-phosphotransferase